MSEYIVRETGYPGQLKQEVVQELVRCKDCRYGIEDDGWIYCHNFGQTERKDFFCADGERKGESDEGVCNHDG